MEQDQYEARLKELFDSFDSTGTGSLGQEELTDLCHMLQLEEVAPSLQHALLQDNPLGRVHFDQFKEALIDVLSSTLSNEENCPEPDCSPEAQPKYIKDGKRYGRRSVPELQDSLEDYDEETVIEAEDEETRSSQVSPRNCEELWRSEEGEEYEAEGQLRFWNPDDLNASQTTLSPNQDWVEEKLQLICEDLGINRDGHLNRKKLISICEQYGFQNLDKEALEDALQNLDQDKTMSLQDFFHEVCKNTKPLTPSSSTPYRQLKRHLSIQPYDETGRRTMTPSTISGTIGFRLFSKLDDGTGYGSVEDIIDLWHEDGLENSQAILKALDFNLEGKINLTELTMTLENELLNTKNEVYHAALASFRSEIRHLVERVDQTSREKEKLRLDLEKNEKLKTLLASEVDDHHAAIESRNEYNLRKLDEEYKERIAALKTELRKEREQFLQQANRQRVALEQELDKVKTEENFLRDRLTLSIKENTRMESELLETSEKLADCEVLTSKLQKSLDNILREKFGDLDPSCLEFFRHEEKLMQLRNEYERQRRELQDRIDELQLELEDYRAQGVRSFRSSFKSSLYDEMDNKNALEYDQGIGSEDCPPLNMSIEAEMAIEQLREQHQREVEQLTLELESKTAQYEEKLKEAKCVFEKEREVLKQKFNDEIQKGEEQIKMFRIKHLELEDEILRLQKEQQRAESEHLERVSRMEAEIGQQKVQLAEKEAAVLQELDEARRTYHKEKEELVQRAEEVEKVGESRLVDLVTSYEEKKNQLEQNFNKQISSIQEAHESETQELIREIKEKHQNEVQEERNKMERRISEIEVQFEKDHESLIKNYEVEMTNLVAKCQNNLQDLKDQYAEEKTQWEFEKEELIQGNVATLEKLKQNFEKEKLMACSEFSQEKDAREKIYKDQVKLIAEKERLQIDLDNLSTGAKQMEGVLSAKILQLESDLQEELTERDEQLCEAGKNIECLRESLEKIEKEHKSEKEDLHSKLTLAENLYKDICEKTEKQKAEMMMEITRLQNTINDLKDEMASLSNVQTEYELVLKENTDLKNTVCQLQNCSTLLEEEKSALRCLQILHEKSISENIGLNSKAVALQEKLVSLEKEFIKNREAERVFESKTDQDEALMVLGIKLMDKEEQLFQAEENVQDLQETIEKLERDHATEIDHLNTKLAMSEALYKETCDTTDAKRQEMLLEISRLQGTICDLQKEVGSLSKIQEEFMMMKQEHTDMKKVVSELQKNSALVDKERNVHKSLQNVHEETVKENVKLLSEISRLQEKLDTVEKQAENFREADENKATEKLRKELEGKVEKLHQAEENIQILYETMKKLEMDHKSENENFNFELLKSEGRFKKACEQAEKRREENTRLQSTITELRNEVASLHKLQVKCKQDKKENLEMKLVAPQLQNDSVVLDDERAVFRSLQNVHEQTVKENVKLLSEVCRLQKKLCVLESKTSKGKVKDRLTKTELVESGTLELVSEGPREVQESRVNDMYCETIKNVNLKLQNKTKELEDTTNILVKLEKGYTDVKSENDHLRAQIILLQEKLNHISLEYDQVKRAIHLEEIALPELEEASMTVTGLKLLLAVTKKENLNLQENVKFMELKNFEAVENNKTLSSEVSWLQKEILNMEEMAKDSLKLEQLYEETKKKNDELKCLTQILQEKILKLERKPVTKPARPNKPKKTSEAEISVQQGSKTPERCSSQGTGHPTPRTQVENAAVFSNGLETEQFSEQNLNYPQDPPESSHEINPEACTQPRHNQANMVAEENVTGSTVENRLYDIQKNLDHLRYVWQFW